MSYMYIILYEVIFDYKYYYVSNGLNQGNNLHIIMIACTTSGM